MTIFTVTTLLDENDAGASVASPGGSGLSLREAIALANSNSGKGNAIHFAPELNGGTIRLAGTLIVTGPLTIDGDNGAQDGGFPNIVISGDTLGNDKLTGSLTNIAASQAAGTLGDNVQLFSASGGALTLVGFVLTGGVTNGNGGAISAQGGLDLSYSVVSGNSAVVDGGGISVGAAGGSVSYTSITGNSADHDGGGVAGSVGFLYATIANNSAGDVGGGIAGPGIGLINSTVSGNHATHGADGISATDIGLQNSIVLGNGASNADEIVGALHLVGGNIVGTNVYQGATDVGDTTASDVFVAIDPATGGAAVIHGGWGAWIPLKDSLTNPAIDGSDNSLNTFALPYDFPAIPNVNGSARDLGAFELGPTGDAPINSLPGPYTVHANTDRAMAGLFVVDPDPGSGTLTTTLSVQHGQLTILAPHGAAVAGSGTSSVTLSGTVAQIDAALAAADNLIYRADHDYFGSDTLKMLTNDNGSGTSTSHTASDQTTINIGGRVGGTSGDDSFTAQAGSTRIDAGAGIDTITFDFKLVDATISFSGNQVIVDGPKGGSHTVLTGFEVFKFSDGTVNNNDGNPLVDDLFYYSQWHDVWNAHADAELHYDVYGWKEGRDPNPYFDTKGYLAHYADVKAAGIDPLVHYDQFGWKEGRDPSVNFDTKHYLAAYPDVAAAHVDPLSHFLHYGLAEGRSAFADGVWG